MASELVKSLIPWWISPSLSCLILSHIWSYLHVGLFKFIHVYSAYEKIMFSVGNWVSQKSWPRLLQVTPKICLQLNQLRQLSGPNATCKGGRPAFACSFSTACQTDISRMLSDCAGRFAGRFSGFWFSFSRNDDHPRPLIFEHSPASLAKLGHTLLSQHLQLASHTSIPPEWKWPACPARALWSGANKAPPFADEVWSIISMRSRSKSKGMDHQAVFP